MSQETTTKTTELEQRIDYLEAENERLNARMDAMSKKLDRVLDDGDSSSSEGENGDSWYDPVLNRRQRKILDGIDQNLSVGDGVKRLALKQAVKKYSDVSRKSTVKEYIQTLATSTHFESAGPGRWEYCGGRADE